MYVMIGPMKYRLVYSENAGKIYVLNACTLFLESRSQESNSIIV